MERVNVAPDSLAQPSPLTTELIPGMTYYPDFISDLEHDTLLRGIDERPNLWKQLNRRRLQNLGGLPHAKGMVPSPLPKYIKPLLDTLVGRGIFPESHKPNHALINRYEPSEGIDAHEDGPVFYPCAAIVSLQSPIVMDFYRKSGDQSSCAEHVELAGSTEHVASIVLHPRSLLTLEREAYVEFLHGIQEKCVDATSEKLLNSLPARESQRRQRTSITVRRCSKTLRFRL